MTQCSSNVKINRINVDTTSVTIYDIVSTLCISWTVVTVKVKDSCWREVNNYILKIEIYIRSQVLSSKADFSKKVPSDLFCDLAISTRFAGLLCLWTRYACETRTCPRWRSRSQVIFFFFLYEWEALVTKKS